MRITLLLVISVFFYLNDVTSQSVNSTLRQGNKKYQDGDFQEAELNFRRALERDPRDVRALYNLSNVLYRQGRYDEASNILEGLANMNLPDSKRADILHNLGNSKLGEQKVKDGIEAYKDALRIRPQDMDTRHNLAYAMRLLQEQEQQQQQKQNDQDDQQDQDQQNQQPWDQDKQEQEKDEQQPRPDQISPQDAERILDALNQQEQKVQENIDREEKQRVPLRVQREW
jgi:Ca-activated chloride channel homolog